MLVYRDGLHLPSPGGAVGTIALSPDSRNLYVPVEAGDRSVVFVFSRDSSTGSVLLQETQHDGLNGFVSIADFRSAVVSADGAYVYTGFTGDAESVMPVFRRDGFSGKLTAIEARPSATMYGARSIAMSPDGGLLYAAGDERLTVVRRDPTTGGVLPIETHDHNGSAFDGPFGIGGLVGTMGIAVSPDGLDVYTASGNDGTVGHFRRLCGNGRRDPGEECDDGNGRDGDGCSALCTIEPCFDCSGDPSTCTPVDGRPCDDGNPRITTERCHGGTCTGGTAANEGRACDDGDACTAGDRCVAGVCRGQEPVVCGLCEACDRRFGWVGTVHDDCHESPTLGRHGTLKFRKHGKGGPLLRWHWVGPQTFLLTDFGVPGLASEPDYQLCLYDHRGLPLAVRHRRAVVAAIHVPAAGRCGKVRCWQAAPNGFRYHDPSAGTDGVTGVSIAAGGQNLASLSLAAHGDRLPFASLPLAPLVTAEFTAPTGVCWRSDYGPFVKKDAADRFIASGGLQVPCRGRCEE
jgi:cysteine-rich repeat protein